ncbi:MAG: GNAT family N-acetyltransferase [Gemmatimonadales bacterium]
MAGPADAPALARLRYDFRAGLHPTVEDEQHFVERCAPWMAERLASRGIWRCWMAEESRVPLGTVWLQLLEKIPNPVGEAELYGYVTSLYVRADRRGAGIGSALLTACLGECESRGADSVFLWPTPRSRPLYQRHGFSVREDMLERRR